MNTDLIQKLEILRDKVQELCKWERSGSMTMVNRDAHYQALATVKEHVLKYITNLVSDMKDEDLKEVNIAGRTLTIRKLMQDMYSGKVVYDNQLVHQFDRTTIPQLAGQLQSLLELYDPSLLPDAEEREPRVLLIDKLKPFAEQANDGMVSQLISILSGIQPEPVVATPENEINDIIREANEITEEAKRNSGSPDPREQIEILKQRVKEMLHRVESIVSQHAPTSKREDLLQDTLQEMQRKHDYLADRVQQELNILEDRVVEVSKRIDEAKGGKTITIRID
jgi:cell division septum initiation protein DivIVA